MYVGLENGDTLTAIDTAANTVVATIPVGQAPQAIAYVPNAVAADDPATAGLQALGIAGQATHLSLRSTLDGAAGEAPTSVTLFDQGLVQVLQASASGLQPKSPYVLGLAPHADGSGTFEPLATFMTNPAGAAIVDTIGAIRPLVSNADAGQRRFLVIAPRIDGKPGAIVQIQAL